MKRTRTLFAVAAAVAGLVLLGSAVAYAAPPAGPTRGEANAVFQSNFTEDSRSARTISRPTARLEGPPFRRQTAPGSIRASPTWSTACKAGTSSRSAPSTASAS